MSTKVREYKIKMPYTITDWRKGQRYVIAKYTTDEVQIVGVKKKKEHKSVITETHKTLDLSKRLPGVVKKVLSGSALCVDEYSTNVDVLTFPSDGEREVVVRQETLKNKDGLLDEMTIKETKELRGLENKEDPLTELNSENLLSSSERDISICPRGAGHEAGAGENCSKCETRYVNKYYDVNTFNLSVKTHVKRADERNIFNLPEGFKSQEFDLVKGRTGDSVVVFKLVEVTINSTFFGWIAESIKNMLRDMLVKFQERMIATEPEWINMSEEEIVKLEEEMVQKFMKKE